MKENNSIFIKNASVITEKGLIKTNLLIQNQLITCITNDIITHSGIESYDASNCIVVPSFVDMHVHLREPGYSYKETIATGTKAAAAGGFTTVCAMPNLNPPPDCMDHLRQELDIISRDACVQVLPFATITKGREGKELIDFSILAPYVAGFSDDGSGVQSEHVMRKAMEGIAKTGKILAAHCEVDSLLQGGYIHKGIYCKNKGHKGICSESEWREVERDITLSEETGCRLHICHISTKESVEMVRNAKKRGLKVTCETGPHYLTFHDMDLKEAGNFKMNPPIRDIEDREALREGIIDGTIDVIATDHAPHSFEEKNRGLEKSAMGVVGLETAFSAVYTTMVSSGLMPFERLIELMCINPRKILGFEAIPYVKEGMEADLVIIDLNENRIVNPNTFYSKGKATPYDGMKLMGNIKMTIYKGRSVFCTL